MFTWTEEMSVGVKVLDEEHRHLFQQVNALLEQLKDSSQIDAVSLHQFLDDIMNYNFYHIKNEEEHMHEFDCVDDEHLAAHKWYIEKTRTLFGVASHAVRSGLDTADKACEEFAMFAGNWHVRHIIQNDQKYKTCFNEHGLY